MHGVRIVFLIFLSGLVRGLDYSHLEALGVTCPERDKCAGYRLNSRPYTDRNCECDNGCTTYGDCCIDANNRRRSSSARTVMPSDKVCLNYGEDKHTGVYAVARCSSGWDGLRQVRRKCEGSPDFSDPMSAAPVTSVSQAVTYKNLFCAECNNADMQSLTTFQFRLLCEGLEDLSQAQIVADLFYDQQRATWGVNRWTDDGGTNFVGCEIIFDAPDYVNASLRFCRSNVVSTCARDWTRGAVRRQCGEYMAVVYDDTTAYGNPHCAICNHRTVDDVSCRVSLSSRKRPMSFALLLDVNQSDGDQVGMTQVATPRCDPGHKYDPFFKRCRKLVCALPGHKVVDGRLADDGATNFVGCEILFEVPSYVNSSLRFCRANVVSTCARDWTRPAVRSKCEQYMAVVYDHSRAYRNPDCAICNRKTVDDVSCRLSISGRKKPQMSLPMIFDINLNEGDRVGITQVATPQCPSGHKYDPFIKKCRKLACAFRGHQVVNGRCVPGGS